MAEVSVSQFVNAAPLVLYELVSDVTRMGQWSPETTACHWIGGSSGPAVGARFRGSNRWRWRRWSTTCSVVEADPGSRFSFDVAYGPVAISRWTYQFAVEDQGCRVTESWVDRRPRWMDRLGVLVMGIPDRAEHNRRGMEATLASLRQFAEAAGRTTS